jgi:hypothetical protein
LKSFSSVRYIDESRQIAKNSTIANTVNAGNFIVGACDSGLLMDSESPYTAPYLTPFVDLIATVSMPADNIRAFNRTMWAANKKLYSGTGITVANLEAVQISFPTYLQFDKGTEIEAICGIYADIFSS